MHSQFPHQDLISPYLSGTEFLGCPLIWGNLNHCFLEIRACPGAGPMKESSEERSGPLEAERERERESNMYVYICV